MRDYIFADSRKDINDPDDYCRMIYKLDTVRKIIMNVKSEIRSVRLVFADADAEDGNVLTIVQL